MPGPSKVIVLDPDVRSGRQIQLGFQREGVAAQIATPNGSRLDLPREGTGLAVVGGSNGDAVELVKQAREALPDAPIVFAGRGAPREDLEAAGADEIVAQPAYLRDVVTIGRLLIGQPPTHRTHLVGSLAEITGVLTLVRALSALGRSAVLTLIRGLRRGEVRFFEGEVTSAQVGLIHGQAALHQLLLWTDARFDFHHEDVVRRQQIPLDHDELFADAERFLAGVRDSSGSLSPAMVLEQDVARIQVLGNQIPTEVHAVLRMFDGHRVLADVLEDSPYRVFETLRVAQRALAVGLLRKATTPRPKATWRAVLAIEEWLVGNETKQAIVARGAVDNTVPVPRTETTGKQKKFKARRPRKRRANDPAPTTKPIQTDIDWGALVPRTVGAEAGPLAGVVPAAQRSGEIVLPAASREEPREKLEALMDAEARDRMFSNEPSIILDDSDVPPKEEAPATSKRKDKRKAKAGAKQAEAQAKTEAKQSEARAKADADAKAKADADAKSRAEADADAKSRAEADARAKADADASKADARAKADADADTRAKADADADARAKADADAQAKAKADEDAAARAKADADARAKADADERAKADGDARAKADGDARAKADAGARAKTDDDAKAATAARIAADAKAMADALAQARAAADAKVAADQAAADARISADTKAALEAKDGRAGSTPASQSPGQSPGNSPGQKVRDLVARHRRESEQGGVAGGKEAGTRANEEEARAIEEARANEAARFEVDARAKADALADAARVAADAEAKARVERGKPTTDARDLVKSLLDEERGDRGGTPSDTDMRHSVVVEPSMLVGEVSRPRREEAPDVPFLATPLAQQPSVVVSDDAITRPFIRPSAEPEAIDDEPSDGVIRAVHPETTPALPPRPSPRVFVQLDDDRPGDTTGEINSVTKPTTPPSVPSTAEPSILVSDLAAAHSIAAGAATSTAPATNIATPQRAAEVSQARRDATGAFTQLEEEFFRAGQHTDQVPKLASASDSFDDLDEGYQPAGFWDRLLGRKKPK